MVIKGFIILLVCLGLCHSGRVSNYLNKPNLDDKDVKEKKIATGMNEYQKPNVEEVIPTTEEVIPTTEESISSTEKKNPEKEESPETEEEEKPETDEEETPETEKKENPETKKKEKPETYKKDKIKSKEKQKTKTEEKEKPEKVEEEKPEKEEEEKPETEEEKPETEEETQTEESSPKEETTTEKSFIGKKCSLTKAQVEKTYVQWCDLFDNKNYPKLLEMYSEDGYIRILSDTYHVHKIEDLTKLLSALKVLESSFKISKCEDFLSGHTSYGCDPKTKTASMKGIMKTKHFDPPISGSFNEILIDEGGKPMIYSQELNIADKK